MEAATVAVDGGPLVALCDASESRGGTWIADGVILFAPHWRESIFANELMTGWLNGAGLIP